MHLLKPFQSPQRHGVVCRTRSLGRAFQCRTASSVQRPPRLGLYHSLVGTQEENADPRLQCHPQFVDMFIPCYCCETSCFRLMPCAAPHSGDALNEVAALSPTKPGPRIL